MAILATSKYNQIALDHISFSYSSTLFGVSPPLFWVQSPSSLGMCLRNDFSSRQVAFLLKFIFASKNILEKQNSCFDWFDYTKSDWLRMALFLLCIQTKKPPAYIVDNCFLSKINQQQTNDTSFKPFFPNPLFEAERGNKRNKIKI